MCEFALHLQVFGCICNGIVSLRTYQSLNTNILWDRLPNWLRCGQLVLQSVKRLQWKPCTLHKNKGVDVVPGADLPVAQDPHQSPSDLERALSVLGEAQESRRKGAAADNELSAQAEVTLQPNNWQPLLSLCFSPALFLSVYSLSPPLHIFRGSSCTFVPSCQITAVLFDSCDLCLPHHCCVCSTVRFSSSSPLSHSPSQLVLKSEPFVGLQTTKISLGDSGSPVVKLDETPRCLG